MMFWLLLLVHHILQQPNVGFACVEEEKIALLDIKLAFNGHESIAGPYSLYKSWNKSTECCSWHGVHCSPTTKHVRHLVLHDSYVASQVIVLATWQNYTILSTWISLGTILILKLFLL
ncbi:Leucine-rich repeat-containing N-terminal plant-type protein [Dioscorea alata]|uniref:Leucine-rich repeat-containing N-terminal plant-type protein n=1 Tax=Dioscorea alata TaxID=55571 RepID=A0ACB7WJY4_DIOAL|nr:Leucine-rich repeat-containing N-terminal plant-type protein [Dioscorea alata]